MSFQKNLWRIMRKYFFSELKYQKAGREYAAFPDVRILVTSSLFYPEVSQLF